MSNMTPFEIRLELLKMAKDMLTDDYYGKREVISNSWHAKLDIAKINGGELHPERDQLCQGPLCILVVRTADNIFSCEQYLRRCDFMAR